MRMLQALIALLLLPLADVASGNELAIVNARIYPAPDAAAITGGTVLVRDGHIVQVGRNVEVSDGATVIDADDGTVTAGFWNSHVHPLPLPLSEAATRPPAELEFALRQMFARWGFTTVFDIASFPPGNTGTLRRRIAAGEMSGPSLLTVDMPFFPADGTPSYVKELLDAMGAPSAEVATASDARARARRQLADGADGVKLFIGAIVDDGAGVRLMDVEIARAVVDEAHRAGKPAFAHPTTLEGIEIAIASGIDVLAHPTPASGPWDDALARRLVDAGLALTPTLELFEIEVRKEQAPEGVVEKVSGIVQQQLRAFHKAGGEVLFGTDVGYIDQTDTRREFELMAAAGMDWRAILASLTITPARRFGQDARKGRVETGLDADLVILGSDPAEDSRAFADVRYTLVGGKVVHPAPWQQPPE